MKYEAIFIDWDGTLSNSRFWERWRDAPEHAEKYDKIQSALFQSAAGKSIVKSWMTGFHDYKKVLDYVAESTQLPYDQLEDELRHSAENMKLIDEGVLPTIQRLREIGGQVIIATDNMDVFSKWTVPALGLNDHFDHILNSSSIMVLKTEISTMYSRSAFFYRYLDDMGMAPKDTVLIDNSPDAKRVEDVSINFLHVTDEQPLSYHLNTILNDK